MIASEKIIEIVQNKGNVIVPATLSFETLKTLAQYAAQAGHVTVKGASALPPDQAILLAQCGKGNVTLDFTS